MEGVGEFVDVWREIVEPVLMKKGGETALISRV
jgi:hypothetical protein